MPPDLTWHRGDLLLTCPAYTAVDLAARPDGGDVIDRALRSRQTTLDRLWAALDAMPRRVGNGQRRRLLDGSRDKPWSELGREGHRLLRRHRLTGWTTNTWVPTRRGGYCVDIDFTWADVFGDSEAVINAIRRAARTSHARRRSAG